MTLDDYQNAAKKTRVCFDEMYTVHGLAEESGEVAGEYKRHIRDDGGVMTSSRRERILTELGDVLWYVAVIAADLGTTLEQVALRNISKLADRQKRGKIRGEGNDR